MIRDLISSIEKSLLMATSEIAVDITRQCEVACENRESVNVNKTFTLHRPVLFQYPITLLNV